MPTTLARRICRATVSALSLAFVASCGGGDGSTPAGPPTPAPTAPTIALGASVQELRGVGTSVPVTATATPSTATVSWRTENSAIATVTANGGSATVTAVSAGTVSIVATATNGSLSAEARLAVTVTPVVKAIVLSPLTTPLAVGSTLRLTATLAADAGASTRLSWTSSDITRARVDSLGAVTAIAPGAVTIVAASVGTPAVSGQAAITVFEPARVRSVAVTPVSDSALVGQRRTFLATVVVDSALAKTVTWRSSNAAIATIDANGVATAVSPGSVSLTAISTVDTLMRASATFTVRAPAVRAVTLSMRPGTLQPGDTATLSTTVTADSGASTALIFESSATSVLTVNSSGRVSAVAPGVSTVTATSVYTPAVRATLVVTVVAAPTATQWTETNDARTDNADILSATNALAALANGTIVGVGNGGAIAERVGGVWRRVASPTTRGLVAVTAAAGTAWAVGGNGTVLRRTSSGWVNETVPASDSLVRVAIRADSTGAAFSATGNRVYERSRTGVWTLTTAPFDALDYLQRFAAAPPGAPIYAAVPSSSSLYPTADVMRWSGSAWVGLPRHATGTDRGVTLLTLPNGELLIAGPENFRVYIARWNGASWTREYQGNDATTANFAAFSMCSDGSIVATTVTGGLLRRVGTNWNRVTLGNTTDIPSQTVVCTSSSDVVGANSERAWKFDGASVSYDVYAPSLMRLSVGSGTNVWGWINRSDMAFRYDGNSWRGVALRQSGGFNNSAPAIAAFGDGTAFAVTAEFNGSYSFGSWTWTPNTDTRAYDLWGTSANDLWAVGQSNSTLRGLVRRSNLTWTSVTPTALQFSDFAAVHGASSDAVMSVTNGVPSVVARWNGNTLRLDTLGGGFVSLLDVAVLSATEAVVVSSTATYRWNGATWSTIACCGDQSPVTVAGRLPNEYYVFGSAGGIYTLTGAAWRKIGQLSRVVRRARMTSTTAIAVGDGGLVVYGRPTLGASARR